jgi:acetyl-CoA carboxylase biotin carboxyl carrier protein
VDLTEIRKLIQLVKRTEIGELEVSEGGRTIRISAWPASAPANTQVVATAPAAANTAPAPAETPAASAEEERLAKIVSPMVGTFYRAPAPDADPYVEVGKQIDVGQTACIIEAMKLMNEIESEVRGRVVKVAVENGQPVEYGQLLFLIDPQG